MHRKPTVNVVGANYAYGLAHCGRIVTDALNQAGFDAAHVNADFYCGDGLWNKVRARLNREHQNLSYRLLPRRFPRRDLNIFLERIPRHMFQAARRHVLIPNQEWFPEKNLEHLDKFDLVVCKTRHAQEIFSKLGCRAPFSSFTSTDRRRPSAEPKRREFFLMVGNRPHTAEQVIDLWARHPEWPRLTVSSRHIPPEINLPNVRLIRDFVPDDEITRLQNSHLFHLCVTTSEGFGHKHNEAMSCGAIVISTDGPPMNELIGPDRGLLVKWDRTNPMGVGAEYHFDETDLERAIEACLRLDDAEIATLSANARAWYEQNDAFFKKQLPEILHTLF